MRRVILVRHASHDRLGRVLCGRMPGVTLSERGRGQAEALARGLADSGAGRVLASPRERAAETAAPVARALGLAVETCTALDEIDFGAWTGRGLADLDGDPLWHAWNHERATARPPGGESMGEVQARVGALLDRLGAEEGPPAILVSHGDVIRAAALRLLGLGPGDYDRLVVDPASRSEVALWPGGGRIVSLNERPAP